MRKLSTLIVVCTIVLFSCSTGNNEDPTQIVPNGVYLNQVGYLPDSEKYFITSIEDSSFQVLDSQGAEVHSGTIELRIEGDSSTGLTLYKGDFSSLSTPGEYSVLLEGGTESYSFTIGSNIYNDVARMSLLSFYYQRCDELTSDLAGEFAHGACHQSPASYHSSVADKDSGTRDVTGGWHDAGDYGKYVHSAAASLAMMLSMYEQFPDKFTLTDNGIPESTNSRSDFLDEMIYELNWLLKMQNSDSSSSFYGACHYMVNTLNYEWVMPQNDSATPFVYDYSTVATADFAAIMAQAARIVEPLDSTLASTYLEAAELAWSYLSSQTEIYPANGFTRPSDTQTGGYAGPGSADPYDGDDRLWAAVELYVTTGDQNYHTAAKELGLGTRDFTALGYSNTASFALIQYLLKGSNASITADSDILTSLNSDFQAYCSAIQGRISNDGFYDSLNSYYWGCNQEIMTDAQFLIYGADLYPAQSENYKRDALRLMNYLLGTNAHNMTFVSRVGTVYPENIHHAQLDSDGNSSIFPGLVPGGPNSSISNDPYLSRTFSSSTPPALCYGDVSESYGSNENCILYTAPLVPVAFYFSNL